MDQFVEREWNQHSQIDRKSLLETLLDTEKEATVLSDKVQKFLIDDNELIEHLKKRK